MFIPEKYPAMLLSSAWLPVRLALALSRCSCCGMLDTLAEGVSSDADGTLALSGIWAVAATALAMAGLEVEDVGGAAAACRGCVWLQQGQVLLNWMPPDPSILSKKYHNTTFFNFFWTLIRYQWLRIICEKFK